MSWKLCGQLALLIPWTAIWVGIAAYISRREED